MCSNLGRNAYLQLLGDSLNNSDREDANFLAPLKDFYEIAALQSGVATSNSDIPDDLLVPLVSISDPCRLENLPYSQINWAGLERTITSGREVQISRKKQVAAKATKPLLPATNLSTNKHGEMGTLHKEEPKSNKAPVARKVAEPRASTSDSLFHEEPMEVDMKPSGFIDECDPVFGETQKHSEAQKLATGVVNLCRIVKKMSADPETTSLVQPEPWIEISAVSEKAELLVVVLSFMPGLLTVEEVVTSLLVPSGPVVMLEMLRQMPELFLRFFELRAQEDMIRKLIELNPSCLSSVLNQLLNSRTDCKLGCKVATDALNDFEFVNVIEPHFINRDSELCLLITRNGVRQVLPPIVRRLLKVVRDLISRPPETLLAGLSTPVFSSRLLNCVVEILGSTDQWSPPDITLITRFVFRTGLQPEYGGSQKGMEPMEWSQGSTMDSAGLFDEFSLNDSVVADSEASSQDFGRAHEPLQASSSFPTTSEPSPFGDTHENVVLAALILFPILTQYPTSQNETVAPPDKAVYRWLDASRKRTSFQYEGSSSQSEEESSFAGALLYAHACVLSGKLHDLGLYVNNVLQRRTDLYFRNPHVLVLKKMLFENCLDKAEVARRSTAQPTTLNLNQNSPGRVPLHTISALQSAGILKALKANIGNWLERQLRSVAVPANSMLVDVIETFAYNSATYQTAGLSQAFVQDVFSGDSMDEERLMSRIYVLLYLVAYREQVERAGNQRNLAYSNEIYAKIPYRYLMSLVEVRHEQFQNIRYRLVLRCSNWFPYMMPTPQSIEVAKESAADRRPLAECLDKEDVLKKIRSTVLEPSKNAAYNYLKHIDAAPFSDQLRLLPIIIEAFMKSLEPRTPIRFTRLIVQLFARFEELVPNQLFESATNAWLEKDGANFSNVYKIPALLFRCDKRILNSPPHFFCFVNTLRFFSTACRWNHRVRMMLMSKTLQHMPDHDRKENELLAHAYADSQQTVTVQALIEVADSRRMGDDESDYTAKANREEIAKIAFEYIHRLFIDHEGLMKVVLFQAFPVRQLRAVVEGVPSMFVAMAYVQEMLTLPNIERRIFTVVLVAELARKYRIQESLDVVRMTIDVVNTLHKYGELPAAYKFWKHLVPALSDVSVVFPSLTDCITRLLQRVSSCAKSRVATHYGILPQNKNCEEKRLLKLVASCPLVNFRPHLSWSLPFFLERMILRILVLSGFLATLASAQWGPFHPYGQGGPPAPPNNNLAIGYPTAYGLWTGRSWNGWNGDHHPGQGTGFGSPLRCLNGGAHIGQCRLEKDSICVALGGTCTHGACCTTPFLGMISTTSATPTRKIATVEIEMIDGEATKRPPKHFRSTTETPEATTKEQTGDQIDEEEILEWNRLVEQAKSTITTEPPLVTVTPVVEVNEYKRCFSGLKPVGPCAEDSDCPTLHSCEQGMCCYNA
ncbi:unnamed protein product [Caenorhabditis auriculariae]|uniref:Uncharacterized protein n=1 Tax=Caenorhabditis auriculariae TaxID=2777116 RepID=A0A8S1HQE2_9PELO|nr:unnamed protein product [Caenorhabditis auriculariae]